MPDEPFSDILKSMNLELSLPSICPVCSQPLVAASTVATLRRGRRFVEVSSESFVCPQGHFDPAAEPGVPYGIVTDAQSRAFYEAVEVAWQARYGEPFPPPARRGRPPATKRRSEPVLVRFTQDEIEAIDLARGETPRAEYLRLAVRELVRSARG